MLPTIHENNHNYDYDYTVPPAPPSTPTNIEYVF